MKDIESELRSSLRRRGARAPDSGPLEARIRNEIARLEESRRKVTPRKPVWAPIAAGVAVALAVVGVSYAFASLGAHSSRSPVASPATTSAAGCRVDRGTLSPGAWLSSGEAQDAVESLGAALKTDFAFGVSATSALDHGLIGMAVAGDAHAIVVVVDPEIVDMPRVQTQLEGVARGRVRVLVANGCNSAAELLRASSMITADLESASPATVELSPYDSTWHVILSPQDQRVGERMTSSEPGLVTVTYSGDAGGVRQ